MNFQRSDQPTQTQTITQQMQRIDWQQHWQTINSYARSTRAQVAYGFTAGLFIGLVVFGWWLWPVEWTDASFLHLADEEKIVLVEALADLNSFDFGSRYVRQIVYVWPESADFACGLALQVEGGKRARLEALAWEVNGNGC